MTSNPPDLVERLKAQAVSQRAHGQSNSAHLMNEAASQIEAYRKALEPFVRQRPHKTEDGLNGVLVPATIADVRTAKALLERREP